MTSKTTKSALIMSILAMLLCLTMLVGSTFAWFTDSATTGVNKIVSGTLEVDLVDKDGNSLAGKNLDFIKADGSEEILWEPGCTYKLPDVYVKNNGNLALKYQIVITGINGDAKLNEAIEWTINLGNAKLDGAYTLAAGATSEAITISGHMKEEAGNEYQGLTIDGISITVVATQATVEHDSYDNQYDKDATYTAAIVTKIPEAELTVNTATGALKLDTGYTFETTDVPEAVKDTAYANWHADFVVTLDKDVPTGALTLAGQYDAWSTDWLAFANPNAITAGTATRLLETAGVSVNYYELCSLVKEFNCGAVGAGLAGTTMTVELRLYETKDPADTPNNSVNEETGKYILIGSYSHTFGETLPTASVSQVPANELTVNATNGMNGTAAPLTLETGYIFTAVDTAETAALSPYATWNADFVVSVDAAVPANALTLAGQYDGWSQDWVAFKNADAVAANEATRLLASVGGKMTYAELCNLVKEFNCGAAATDELTGATMTVELRLFETEDGVETGNYKVIGSYSYTFQ